MKIDKIYTDGASRGNPGLSSYAVIVFNGDEIFRYGKAFECSTNNRMEILAGITALDIISNSRSAGDIGPEEKIPIYSDSALLCNMFNKGWLSSWQRNNTVNFHANPDLLWRLIESANKAEHYEFIWVRAHSGIKGNEMADRECNQLLDNFNKTKL